MSGKTMAERSLIIVEASAGFAAISRRARGLADRTAASSRRSCRRRPAGRSAARLPRYHQNTNTWTHLPARVQRWLRAVDLRGLPRPARAAARCAIPFRVAETPLFLLHRLREDLERSATEIVRQIPSPALIVQMKRAIPAHLDVPGMDPPRTACRWTSRSCAARTASSRGKVVEQAGSASLYALMLVQVEIMAEVPRRDAGARPALVAASGAGAPPTSSRSFAARSSRGSPEESAVLLDLAPEKQKTYLDFVATKSSSVSTLSVRRRSSGRVIGCSAAWVGGLVQSPPAVQPRRVRRARAEAGRARSGTAIRSTSPVLAPELVLDLVEVHAALHRSPRAPRRGC